MVGRAGIQVTDAPGMFSARPLFTHAEACVRDEYQGRQQYLWDTMSMRRDCMKAKQMHL